MNVAKQTAAVIAAALEWAGRRTHAGSYDDVKQKLRVEVAILDGATRCPACGGKGKTPHGVQLKRCGKCRGEGLV